MPVRIKPEMHDSLVSVPAPQSPPPPVSSAANGPSAADGQPPACGQSQRTPNASQASSNPTGAPVSTASGAANGAGEEKEAAQTISEDAVDYDSIRGVFGWTMLDGVNVPYIIRTFRAFVAVRIVEKKMLSKYPNSFPDELGRRDPLISYFVTEAEARLLNEINTIHCSYEYGHQPFSTKDLIVDLAEFEEFYTVVKKTFPDDVPAAVAAEATDTSGVDDELSKVCGWMQINNVVTPYIVRASGKFVPLSVMLYAARLLTKDHVEGYLPTEEECALLNSTCRGAGLDFSFGKNTELIHISEVVRRCQVRIFELPFENPLRHAQYIDSLQRVEGTGTEPSRSPPLPSPGGGGCGGVQGSTSLPYQSKPTPSERPPNFNPFTYYSPLMSAGGVFPPASPFSVGRGSQVTSNNPLVPQPSGVVPGRQRPSPSLATGPPHVGVSPVSQPWRFSPPPVSQSWRFPPPQFTHGGVPPGRVPYSDVPCTCSSPSGAPPPCMPPHPHRPQRPGQPPTRAHCGPLPHRYTQPRPHLTGRQNEMMVWGMGSMPRRRDVPDVAGLPRLRHPRMRVLLMQNHQPPQHRPQVAPRPADQRPSPGPRSSNDTSAGWMASDPPLPRVFPGQQHPVFQPQPAVFPVRLIPAANKGPPVSAPGVDPVSNKPAPDERLELVADIKPVMYRGKSISCVRRDAPGRRGNFCLVEAVAELYFPGCSSLSEFVDALRDVLRINLPVCTEAEAEALARFDNLPVTSLNDNHLITLEDLNEFFPQIYYMFRNASDDSHDSPLVNHEATNTTRRSIGTEGTTRIASPSAPITVVLNNDDSNSAEVIEIHSVAPSPCNDRNGAGDGVDGVSGGKMQRFPRDEVADGPSSVTKKPDTVDNAIASDKSSTKPPGCASQVIVID